MAKISFFFLFFIACFLSVNAKCDKKDCDDTPCNDLTVKQTIIALWGIPKKLSQNMERFKKSVINSVDGADDTLTGLLLAQSLWALDSATGFTSDPHPSCLFNNLIVTNNDLADGGCFDGEGYDKSVVDYGALCVGATDYTVYQGLLVAGCPVKKPEQPCSERCDIDGELAIDYLNKYVTVYPACLKRSIIRLLKSNNPDEKLVGAAAVASGTNSNSKLFKSLLQNEALLRTCQLKACNIKIPRECCDDREKELKKRTKALNKRTDCTINRLIDED